MPTDFAARFAGTISEGTLRPEDLIPKLVDLLSDVLEWWELETPPGEELYRTRISSRITDGLGRIERAMDAAPGYFDNGAGDDLEWLFMRLSELAPEGFVFGPHPGDGCDFGFWYDGDEADDEVAA